MLNYILIQIILASLAVSLVAVIAVLALIKFGRPSFLQKTVALAAGVLLAFVWLDLLPEAVAGLKVSIVGSVILITIICLLLIEIIFRWHHCQHADCTTANKHKHLIVLNLLGDGLHNFIDGVVIASTLMVDLKLGLMTTLAVMLHEIPQELADAGILLYAGLTKKKVLIFNFMFALTAVVGGVGAYFLLQNFEWLLPYLLAIVAGNFLYLSLSDLVPMIHHQENRQQMFVQTGWLLCGVGLVVVFKFLLF